MIASNRKRPKEPAIIIPSPADEKPRFGRVALIALIGFAVGVAWPALARVQLVPQPPEDPANAAPAASGSIGAPGSAPNEAAIEGLPSVRPAVPPAPSPAIGPKVKLADIVSCTDADGRKRQKCDAPGLDAVLSEPLKGLLACDGAEGQSGVLSLGFDLDFATGNVGRITVGRSTTLDTALARSLAECAKSRLTHFDVSAIEHSYSSYRVFYLIEFTRAANANREPANAPSVSATGTSNEGMTNGVTNGASPATNGGGIEGELQGQSGRATVTWDVAIVRKAPKDGAIVARVLNGTRVVVTGRQGDWYRIKYNAKGDEGFVFKSAIGQ